MNRSIPLLLSAAALAGCATCRDTPTLHPSIAEAGAFNYRSVPGTLCAVLLVPAGYTVRFADANA